METYNGLEIIQGDAAAKINSFRGNSIDHCGNNFDWLTK